MEPVAARNHSQWRVWLYPLALLGGTAAAWFLLLLGLDYLLTFTGNGRAFWIQLTGYSPSDVQQALGSLPEVVAAILGIAITVVSIVLQLSSTRYTPRVTEMFFLDRTNLLVMGFFVVATIQCVWATTMVHESFIPHVVVLATVLIMTAAILILIPYFSYVFAFLDPERIVARIQEYSLREAVQGKGKDIALRQQRVLQGVEQIADVAINSISQKDRVIASGSVDALRDLVLRYADKKEHLSSDWFQIGAQLRRNPDFVAMASESVAKISDNQTWLEWKVLRQYQTISADGFNRMRAICQLVAIDSRYVGEKAVDKDDRHLLNLVIKFFNTYLRGAINAHDVRSAYNILHQYRLLGERLLSARWDDEVVEVATYFKYYGLTANAAGLPFVNETAAYDLCALCEKAHLAEFPLEQKLLAIFLEVDKQPETETQELSLRGVRKAQIKLATFYLDRDQEALARQVFEDMEHERLERLLSIREEMEAVVEEDFWEVIDRGYNFDYLEPRRRKQIQKFYSWFRGIRHGTSRSDGVPDPR